MKPVWSIPLAVVLLAALSFAPRWILHARSPDPATESWMVADPDGLYHARRVDRALDEGLPVAGRDSLLNHPDGAPIPWPPYYDTLLTVALRPFAPEAMEARRGFVERAVATAPLLLGIATTLLAFFAARAIAGDAAGVVAGISHALCTASIVYSHSGNGDHHAFISFLAGAVLLIVSATLSPGPSGRPRLASPAWAWGGGVVAGALAGLAMGSWVAALLHVILVELVLAWWLFRHSRRSVRGLPAFGLAFHLAAAAVLLPAILQSPWKDELPWIVVNLSWFHLLFLSVGAAVFAPLFLLRPGGGMQARYPWVVGAVLAGIVLVSWAFDIGPARGIAEGFAWVSRADMFMSDVAESRPLLGPGADPSELILYLGWGIPFLPLFWLGALFVFVRRGEDALLPWLVAVLLLALLAARQVRFAEALVLPAAVLFGWGLVAAARRVGNWVPARYALAALVALACLSQGGTIGRLVAEVSADAPRHPERRRNRAARAMSLWLRDHAAEASGAVLATWSRGHELEWAARRPTVATNFGSYVGEEGFRTPARFFLAEDPVRAEEVMASRDARWVLISCLFPGAVQGLVHSADAGLESRYFDQTEQRKGVIRPAWFRTIGARLLFGGRPHARARMSEEPSLDFLRLVYASPLIFKRSPLIRWSPPTPYGWIWERVPGARVEAKLPPGAPLEVEIELHYASEEGDTVQIVHFVQRSLAEADGVAKLRIPYATTSPNGTGTARSARWKSGAIGGELRIDETDVLEGRTLLLP